jgi:chromosome segregation ATPase
MSTDTLISGYSTIYSDIYDRKDNKLTCHTRLTSLNNRFVTFLSTVKNENENTEQLQSNLIQIKKTITEKLSQKNANYENNLKNAKQMLNDLYLATSNATIKQRHANIVSEWYKKLIQFNLSYDSTKSLNIRLDQLNTDKNNLINNLNEKTKQCVDLKEKNITLNNNLNEIINNLDSTKVDNVHLSTKVSHLRNEIAFLKKLNTVQSKKDQISDKIWFKSELNAIEKRMRLEFSSFYSDQMKMGETELSNHFYSQVDKEVEIYDNKADENEKTTDECLAELDELKNELEANFIEFEGLKQDNSRLNDRLLALGDQICS